jgi:hypothetical protein
MNTDPDPDPIRIQGFDDQKLKKKLQLKKNYLFGGSKTSIYLSLGLHTGRPSYRRSLQLSKENIQPSKHEISFRFRNTGETASRQIEIAAAM